MRHFPMQGFEYFIIYLYIVKAVAKKMNLFKALKDFLFSQLTHVSWVQMKEKVLHAIKRHSSRWIAWINADLFDFLISHCLLVPIQFILQWSVLL